MKAILKGLLAVSFLAGMAVAVGVYLAFNGGRSSAAGWGIAMSTDTAFALGLLALVGPRFPDRLRAFMLTVVPSLGMLHFRIQTLHQGYLSSGARYFFHPEFVHESADQEDAATRNLQQIPRRQGVRHTVEIEA